MMLGETPTVVQRCRSLVGALDHDARDRLGAGLRRQDAHLVVDEAHLGQHGIVRQQRLAQRGVERVDRAVAVGHGHELLAADLHLDRRLRIP